MKLWGNKPRHSKVISMDRLPCPACDYPMKILKDKGNDVYQCYCAHCGTDRVVKVIK